KQHTRVYRDCTSDVSSHHIAGEPGGDRVDWAGVRADRSPGANFLGFRASPLRARRRVPSALLSGNYPNFGGAPASALPLRHSRLFMRARFRGAGDECRGQRSGLCERERTGELRAYARGDTRVAQGLCHEPRSSRSVKRYAALRRIPGLARNNPVSLSVKIHGLRGGSRSRLPSSANERFHVIEITLEGAAACRRKTVLGFGQPTVKHLGAVDISSFLELAGVYGQISIGSPEQSFQFVERERRIHR